MANILASQSGNWYNTSTWVGGVIPNSDDEVFLNNKTITIDSDIYCLHISNKAQHSAAAGGSLVVTSNVNLNVGTLATTFAVPLSSNDFPIPSDVRFGVSYAGGNVTGSCYVPSASSVSFSVPIDDTVGLAILDASTLWSFDVNSLPSTGIGGRLKNCATVEAVGAQIAAFLP